MTCSLEKLYKVTGISKQSFHGYLDRLLARKSIQQQVMKLITEVRRDHPDMGLREMYFLIMPKGMGRDAFEAFGNEQKLGVRVFKNFQKTTDSSGTKFFPNLIEKQPADRLNHIWQSDITYYAIKGRFHYITLIQDAFSKCIVGHCASSSLETENTTLPSAKMAFKKRKPLGLKGLILHSDGGGQYYDKEFLNLTLSYGVLNSMGKSCYENAMAESLNGVVKNKYLRFRNIQNLTDLKLELDRVVELYNSSKPHSALGRMTPQLFEKKHLTYLSQTEATMTESTDAECRMKGASSPFHSSQTKAQNPDVISADD
ncbi:IS3 family transposase [Cyclobacteriaceae bacterium YHN15]|jgi:putative transposase|nr:IS3 family transposase [Cyclobacteriaceae bacterium YHN15]